MSYRGNLSSRGGRFSGPTSPRERDRDRDDFRGYRDRDTRDRDREHYDQWVPKPDRERDNARNLPKPPQSLPPRPKPPPRLNTNGSVSSLPATPVAATPVVSTSVPPTGSAAMRSPPVNLPDNISILGKGNNFAELFVERIRHALEISAQERVLEKRKADLSRQIERTPDMPSAIEPIRLGAEKAERDLHILKKQYQEQAEVHRVPVSELLSALWPSLEFVAPDGNRSVLKQPEQSSGETEALKSRVDELTQKMEAQQEAISSLINSNTTTKTALKLAQDRAEQVEKGYGALNEKHQELIAENQRITAENQRITSEQKRVAAEIKKLSAIRQELSDENEKLVAAQRMQTPDELKRLGADLGKAKEELQLQQKKHLDNTAAQHKKDIALLRGEISKASKDQDKLVDRVKEVEKKMGEVKASYGKPKVGDATPANAGSPGPRNNNNTATTNQADSIKQMDEKLVKLVNLVKAINSTVASHGKKLEELQTHANKADKAVSDLESIVLENGNRVAELDKFANKAEDDLRNLNASTAEEDIRNLTASTAQLKSRTEDVATFLAEFKERLGEFDPEAFVSATNETQVGLEEKVNRMQDITLPHAAQVVRDLELGFSQKLDQLRREIHSATDRRLASTESRGSATPDPEVKTTLAACQTKCAMLEEQVASWESKFASLKDAVAAVSRDNRRTGSPADLADLREARRTPLGSRHTTPTDGNLNGQIAALQKRCITLEKDSAALLKEVREGLDKAAKEAGEATLVSKSAVRYVDLSTETLSGMVDKQNERLSALERGANGKLDDGSAANGTADRTWSQAVEGLQKQLNDLAVGEVARATKGVDDLKESVTNLRQQYEMCMKDMGEVSRSVEGLRQMCVELQMRFDNLRTGEVYDGAVHAINRTQPPEVSNMLKRHEREIAELRKVISGDPREPKRRREIGSTMPVANGNHHYSTASAS